MISKTISRTEGADPVQRTSVRDQALERIKQYIAVNKVAPGQRLPSERELAEQLGVGRNSLREALRALETVGVIESRVGGGTFLTAHTGTSIGRTIGLRLAVWGGTILEIHTARKMIEVETARFAAEHATEDEIRQLAAQLYRMDTADHFRDYISADMEFHRIVARASHNQIVAEIVNNLTQLLEGILRETPMDELSTRAEATGTGTHHRLFAAVSSHNLAEAASEMRAHLNFSTDLWQAIIALGRAYE